MLQLLFFVLLALALAGDARIFLFVANTIVFGAHKEEEPRLQWLLKAVPILLIVLTLLFWPLHRWIAALAENSMVERITPDRFEEIPWSLFLARVGATWLLIAAAIGLYWIVDRFRILLRGETRVAGTKTLPSEVVRLRKAHMPIAALRRLGAHNDLYDLEVTRHEVFISNLPPSFDGYRVAFLTDTHVASFVRHDFYRAIVERTMGFRPDVILLGGDFVHWEKDIPLLPETILHGLHAPDGIYAVPGNHDYWANIDGVIAVMTAAGVRFLVNRSLAIVREGTSGDERIWLVGIDEVYRGVPDLDAAFGGTRNDEVRLGLSHHPDIVDRLTNRRLDLLVCGHTHGGQIRFPFFGSVVVPSVHEARYASGFHRVGGVLLYVSRGIGAIPPVRILCKPEIATFTLRRTPDP